MIYYQQIFFKQMESLNMLCRLSGTPEFKQSSYFGFLLLQDTYGWLSKYPLPYPVWPNIKYFPQTQKTAAMIS